MHVTDVSLLRQLEALAANSGVPVNHIVEYACYQYLMELIRDVPNIVHAVPELRTLA